MLRNITDMGITHRNHYEDIRAGYIPQEYGFMIQLVTEYNHINIIDTRWVSYDEDGAYIIWSSIWSDNRFISEADLEDSELCLIEGMIDSHLETLTRELYWAEEY